MNVTLGTKKLAVSSAGSSPSTDGGRKWSGRIKYSVSSSRIMMPPLSVRKYERMKVYFLPS